MRRKASVFVLVPTRNRPHFLARLLEYLARVGFPYPVWVADSSDERDLRVGAEVVERHASALELRHLRFDPDTDYVLKIVSALEDKAAPRMVALCGDDDFLVAGGVRACADYLEKHDDYAVASGACAVVVARPRREGPGFEVLNGDYPQHSIDDDDPRDRLRHHLAAYMPNFYAVHRSAGLARALREAQRLDLDFRLFELAPSALEIIDGKWKCLAEPYMVRQGGWGSTAAGVPSWASLLLDERFPARYGRFRASLATRLAIATSASESAAAVSVDDAFEGYLARTGLAAAWRLRRFQTPDRSRAARLIDRACASVSMLVSRKPDLAGGDPAAWCARTVRESERRLERFGPVFDHVRKYPTGIVGAAAGNGASAPR